MLEQQSIDQQNLQGSPGMLFSGSSGRQALGCPHAVQRASRMSPSCPLICCCYCLHAQGVFLHVAPIEPTSSYDCSTELPWWRDPTLKVCTAHNTAHSTADSVQHSSWSNQIMQQAWGRAVHVHAHAAAVSYFAHMVAVLDTIQRCSIKLTRRYLQSCAGSTVRQPSTELQETACW